MQGRRDVLILAMDQASIAINHRDAAAKPAHGLRQLKPDKAASQHEEMFWNAVQFQSFDVGQGLRLSQTRSGIDGSAGSRVDHDPLPSQDLRGSFCGSNL